MGPRLPSTFIGIPRVIIGWEYMAGDQHIFPARLVAAWSLVISFLPIVIGQRVLYASPRSLLFFILVLGIPVTFFIIGDSEVLYPVIMRR